LYLGAYVPTTHQLVFLTVVDTAEPQAAADMVAAAVILDGLTADTGDLQAAGLVTDEGLFTIATDSDITAVKTSKLVNLRL
jgi:hypothetical protein